MRIQLKKALLGALFGLSIAGIVTACVDKGSSTSSEPAGTEAIPQPQFSQKDGKLNLSKGTKGEINSIIHNGALYEIILQGWTFQLNQKTNVIISLEKNPSNTSCQTEKDLEVRFQLQQSNGKMEDVSINTPFKMDKGSHKLVAKVINKGLCTSINIGFRVSVAAVGTPPTPPIVGSTSSKNIRFQKFTCGFSFNGKPQPKKTMTIETVPFVMHYFHNNNVNRGMLVEGRRFDGLHNFCGQPLNKAFCHSSGAPVSGDQGRITEFFHRCEYESNPGHRTSPDKSRIVMDRNSSKTSGQYRCNLHDNKDQVLDFTCDTIYDHGTALPIQAVQGIPELSIEVKSNGIDIGFKSGLKLSGLDALPINTKNIVWNLYSVAPKNKTSAKGFILKNNKPVSRIVLTDFGVGTLAAGTSDLNGAFSFANELKNLHLVFGVPNGDGTMTPIFNVPLNLYCTSYPGLFTNGSSQGCPGI